MIYWAITYYRMEFAQIMCVDSTILRIMAVTLHMLGLCLKII